MNALHVSYDDLKIDDMLLNDCLDTEYCDKRERLSNKDKELIYYMINNTERHSDGRLIMPALFNKKCIDQLPNNFFLALGILKSVYKNLEQDFDKLLQYDQVIQDQIKTGIVEPVNNLSSIKNNKNISFLAHKAVFRANTQSTKCRIVYMSNLCEKGVGNLSHNQVSFPGPNLNKSIDIAVTLMRFDKYLIIFDLVKAFHMIRLHEEFTKKLYFLWFKDIKSKKLDVAAFRFLRLPFGMRFSPSVLMMALYIILILHVDLHDNFEIDMRKSLYSLAYMDNLAYTSSDEGDIWLAYNKCQSIFSEFGFSLQQFATNLHDLQTYIDQDNEKVPSTVKLLGLLWNREKDSLKINFTFLNNKANTLRTILASVNSIYDPLGIYLPTKNRAKLFLNELQNNKSISWDSKLEENMIKEWIKICKQYNASKFSEIPRYLGERSYSYDLIGFVDASRDLIGVVLYLKEVSGNELKFLSAKNKIIPKKNADKTIPVLELSAVRLGVHHIMDVYQDFTSAFSPININTLRLYTDSTIVLNWLIKRCIKHDKIERKGNIINNLLDTVVEMCEKKPVHFYHINGKKNPADCVTRVVSAKVLSNSYYFSGPDLSELPKESALIVPDNDSIYNTNSFYINGVPNVVGQPIISLDKISSFKKLCRIMHFVRLFFHKLRLRVHKLKPHLFPSLKHDSQCLYSDSCCAVIKQAQTQSFPDVVSYFQNPLSFKEPPLVVQLNLFIDNKGLIRVKSKLNTLNAKFAIKCPILMSKNCPLTKILVMEQHIKQKHSGIYKLLSVLRKEFYITSGYSAVKRIIKSCILCKKMYGRSIRLNQNSFKDYRINPVEIPFRELALDHIGPFLVKNDNKETVKVYILILTCFWSRAVNLVLCNSVDTESFLRAFQIHVFEWGQPQRILSDEGTSIVASMKIIKEFLNDVEVLNFLKERNVKVLEFSPYPSGASFLGGTVESMVKLVKNTIYSSISKNVLPYNQFYLLVKECNMLINKRPVAFKTTLRNFDEDPSVPSVITPELLLKGYDVPNLIIAPHLHITDITEEDESTWSPSENRLEFLNKKYETLRKVRKRLNELYYNEFLQNLREISTDRKFRYKANKHERIEKGDLVAIKQPFCKPYFFQMGIVVNVEINSLGETVAVYVKKSTGEKIRRHTSDIIILMKNAIVIEELNVEEKDTQVKEKEGKTQRKSAKKCQEINMQLAKDNLV